MIRHGIGVLESQFKNVNSTTDHHSRPEACKIAHSIKGKHADSLEPEVTIKMEERSEAFEPSWEVQEQCHHIPPLTGQTSPIHRHGQ